MGGVPSAGGAGVGGSVATSSIVATGGGHPTGGAAAATGGVKAGGGTSTAGGSSSKTTGGSTSEGGAANSLGCNNSNLPVACNTATTGPCTLTVNGTARQYYVVLPTNYNASTPYPVVFAWHGLGGTAQSLLGSTYYAGFYGVKTGFPNAIYVTAQGLDTGMNDSGTSYGWANTNDQDVNFTKAMLAWLESNYCVDQSRLFSTGMSYGGMMSDTLGCEMSDVFRALGVMSGSLGFCNGTNCYTPTCSSTRPIAAWFTHGDADTTVPIAGDQNARDHFIKINGCDTTNTQTVAMSDGITTCTKYSVCSSGPYPVVWCPVPGEGHTIPSWAGAEIAKFFLQF
jgi:poly(3-hydroxybutyrate) depolymerase